MLVTGRPGRSERQVNPNAGAGAEAAAALREGAAARACSDAVVVAAACPQGAAASRPPAVAACLPCGPCLLAQHLLAPCWLAAASLLPAVAACLPGAAASPLEEAALIPAEAGSKVRSACLQRRRRGGGLDCCPISVRAADLRRILALTAHVLPGRQTQSRSLPQKKQDQPRPQGRQGHDPRRPHERCRRRPWRSERPAPPASSPAPAEPRPLTPPAALRMATLRVLLVRLLVPTPRASSPARCRPPLLARERLSPPASTCGRVRMNDGAAASDRGVSCNRSGVS